jgi:hypothetical protein
MGQISAQGHGPVAWPSSHCGPECRLGAHDVRRRVVTVTAATTVARLTWAHRWPLRREVCSKSSRTAAGWHWARWWAVRLTRAGCPWRREEMRWCSGVPQRWRHSGDPRRRRPPVAPGWAVEGEAWSKGKGNGGTGRAHRGRGKTVAAAPFSVAPTAGVDWWSPA